MIYRIYFNDEMLPNKANPQVAIYLHYINICDTMINLPIRIGYRHDKDMLSMVNFEWSLVILGFGISYNRNYDV